MKAIKDESTRLSKLRKGELHLVQNYLGREQAVKAAESEKLNIFRRNGLNTTYLGFNFKDKLVGNKAVRKAIHLAVNRDEIIEHVLMKFGSKASSLLTPGTVSYTHLTLPTTPYV